MNKLLIINVIVISSFFSCNNDIKQKSEKQVISNYKSIDVTSYTGNAIAFFSEGNNRYITLIPVLEKDSIKFKDADIFQSIKGRYSVNMFIGKYLIKKLEDSNEKKELKRKICNVWSATYYIKIWISYKNYEDYTYKKRRNEELSDSCNSRDIANTKYNSKLIEFKILNNNK
jgi:hypothetical protein